MSEIYDNWDRLVRATLRREDLKCSAQRIPSDLSSVSLSSSSSYRFSSSSPPQVSPFDFAGLCFGGVKAATKNFDPMKKEIDIFSLKNIKAFTSNFNLGAVFKTNQGGVELYPGGVYNFQHIMAATNNFDTKNKIGEVRGTVYKGVLPNGVEIAAKQLSPKWRQRAREIINEIGTIYALQHQNLARPLGCYAEKNQILLVYKYMEKISLEHALFGFEEEVKSRLNWQTRVKICLGIAKGLAFLHEESKLDIIHGNIKPSNILLDNDFNVKISDFGYSQFHEEQINEQERACGDMPSAKITGHMAPEYIQGRHLTPKVDVYSFGIVTLENLSGQKIISFRPKRENIYLLNTAYKFQQQNNLIALLDSKLGNDYKTNEANTILQLAMDCVRQSFVLRPTMSHAVEVLEGKKLQTSANKPHCSHDYIYNFQQILAATNNFDAKNKIGEGRGTVYKGVLPYGVEIAVKQLLPKSKERAREIINEIGTIYVLQHQNLARPLGCCAEKDQILLVYNMENISLEHALFGSEEIKSRLNWQTRVKICSGIAKGLAFLHEESKLEIIHGNIKPSNILLDKDFNVKITDFGYSKLHAEQSNEQDTACGNMPSAKITGHMAPEYIQGRNLTPKVDVYSFGIVTLEILSGQKIINFKPKSENIYLLIMAYKFQQQNNLIGLLDSRLKNDYKTNEANTILHLAMDCVSQSFDLRPAMSHAVEVLKGKIELENQD